MISARPSEAVLGIDEWDVAPRVKGEQIFDEEDRICTTHPVYVIPRHKMDEMVTYYTSKSGF
jgi:protein farnesyltransferase subunit beta